MSATGNKLSIEDDFLKDLRSVTEDVKGCEWKREYQPTNLRRWKVDIASVPLKIAIEIEGRRHGTAKQCRSDSEKSNLLAAHGWVCLRYPASSILNKKRRGRILEQICRIVFSVPDEASDSCVLVGE